MAITQKDIDKLSGVFATKDEIKEVKNELKELRNDVLNSHDDLVKRFDDMRTEKLMLLSQNRRHEDSISNHEERIVRLEKEVLV